MSNLPITQTEPPPPLNKMSLEYENPKIDFFSEFREMEKYNIVTYSGYEVNQYEIWVFFWRLCFKWH